MLLDFEEFSSPPLLFVIGAGGKTSFLYRLQKELALVQKSALISTTTFIYDPGPPFHLYLCPEKEDLPKGPLLFPAVLGRWKEGRKIKGIPADWCKELLGLSHHVLFEADGARGLPLKFLGRDEPVLPQAPSEVVLLIGARSFHQPLHATTVHRSELATEKLALGDRPFLDAKTVTELLLHEESYGRIFKQYPVTPFINQGDTLVDPLVAREVARNLLPYTRGRVFFGSLQDPYPIWEVID